jgi:hypothetical protein
VSYIVQEVPGKCSRIVLLSLSITMKINVGGKRRGEEWRGNEGSGDERSRAA